MPPPSLWQKYKAQTCKLKKKVALEKKEYLSKKTKLQKKCKLEMLAGIANLPLRLELEKRFTNGMDFYEDYVAQRIKRDDFTSDQEYRQALEIEAWVVGYSFGYREGLAGYNDYSARRSLRC